MKRLIQKEIKSVEINIKILWLFYYSKNPRFYLYIVWFFISPRWDLNSPFPTLWTISDPTRRSPQIGNCEKLGMKTPFSTILPGESPFWKKKIKFIAWAWTNSTLNFLWSDHLISPLFLARRSGKTEFPNSPPSPC